MPEVYEAIGPAAIPILTKYIADPSCAVATRINAMTGLMKIITKYPEYKEKFAAFFTEQLEQFAQNDPEINGYLITNLAQLKATETFPLIQKAFADENVDEFLISLEDVEVSFGLRERPEPRFTDFKSFLQTLPRSEDQENSTPISQAFPQPRAQQNFTQNYSSSTPKASKNKKTKKAQAKASRKKNRKK